MWKKVITPVILIASLWAVLSITTNYHINKLHRSYSKILRENVNSIETAGAMQHTLWRLQTSVMDAMNNPSEDAWIAVGEEETRFRRHLSDAENATSTAGENKIINAIRDGFAKYVERVENLKKPIAGQESRFLVDQGQLAILAKNVADPCDEWFEHHKTILAKEMTAGNRLIASYYTFRFIYLGAGLLIGILFGIWVAKGLHRSVSQIKVVLQNASNELEQEVGHVDILVANDLAGVHRQLDLVSRHITNVVEQLQQTRRDAIRSERLAAVGELAAGVAHEIRNPLTSIKLLIQSETQEHQALPLDNKELQIVLEEIARMERTIQGLLDFARPPALRRSRHDLRDTVQRAIRLVKGRAHQQNVSIVEELPDFPLWIDGDPEQLHQVFVNLLLNGIDSMTEGGSLQVTIQKLSQDMMCRLSFTDSGGGIPNDMLDRIFDPFITTKERGTGLGLALSLRIVQDHGGVIKVVNRGKRGAVFTVELPLEAERCCENHSADGPRTQKTNNASK
jgi:two-component system, NtrC family, sensor histidine kinase HydH